MTVTPRPPAPTGAAMAVRLSRRTGEVQRPVLVGVTAAVLASGAAVAATSLVRSLLTMTGDDITLAGWLVSRINPAPSSWQSVLMPLMHVGLLLPGLAAAGVAAFQHWNGRRSASVVGVVAAALMLLALLVGGPLSWAAVALTAVGALLLWLPPARRYQTAQTHLVWQRSLPAARPDVPSQVSYGPLPRYR